MLSPEEQDPDDAPVTLVVRDVISETADTKSFVLSCKHDLQLAPRYKAGQFLTFVFTRLNGGEVRRNYSISSSPALQESLTITVKRIANGEFSRHLVDTVRPGDELRTIGASGFFLLPEQSSSYRKLFFFAAGSGITPIFSLIKTALVASPALQLVLVYSNKTLQSTIFYDQLQALQQQYPAQLRIVFIFSDHFNLLTARLNSNLLTKILSTYQEFPDEQVLFYICGPLDYMRLLTIFLQTRGTPATQIRKEIFHIEKPARVPRPPDEGEHQVSLHFRKSNFSFNVQYPVTILQAARRQGISLPYSCESGQCGTCVARCVSGKVWMYNNEVLTDDELEKGLVLTCTGYPIDGDVHLEV